MNYFDDVLREAKTEADEQQRAAEAAAKAEEAATATARQVGRAFLTGTVFVLLEQARLALEKAKIDAEVGNGNTGEDLRYSLTAHPPRGAKVLTFVATVQVHHATKVPMPVVTYKSGSDEQAQSITMSPQKVEEKIGDFLRNIYRAG